MHLELCVLKFKTNELAIERIPSSFEKQSSTQQRHHLFKTQKESYQKKKKRKCKEIAPFTPSPSPLLTKPSSKLQKNNSFHNIVNHF